MKFRRKFEEVYSPAVDEFVYISDNTYTKEEIFDMEGIVLNVLQFNLTAPTSRCFVKRYLKAAMADTVTSYLASVCFFLFFFRIKLKMNVIIIKNFH